METSMPKGLSFDKLVKKRDLKELELRLIIKLGVMLVASIGIFATLIKLL